MHTDLLDSTDGPSTNRDRDAAALAPEQAADLAAFRTAFESAPLGMALCDVDGRILRVNIAFAAILGYTPDELLTLIAQTERPREEQETYDRLREEMLLGLRAGYTLRQSFRHRDGRLIWVAVCVALAPEVLGHPMRMVCQMYDITELKQAEDRAEWLATHDPLTGAANRNLLNERLAVLLPHRPAVLFVDVDRFKRINDTLGHLQGDSVLCAVTTRIQAQVRATDLVARSGGDEFVVLLDGADEAVAVSIAQAILAAIEPLAQEMGYGIGVSVSIGIAIADGDTADELLERADEALYRAKRRGREQLSL
jgi:diguanylate cyclase (GGDEF)-like protein/PAS domain S-box-containing protein